MLDVFQLLGEHNFFKKEKDGKYKIKKEKNTELEKTDEDEGMG